MALDKFAKWCTPAVPGYRRSVSNAFLAYVAALKHSDSLAKASRAAACWMCDLHQLPRPVDRLMWKLVLSVSYNYKTGQKPLLTICDYQKLTSPRPKPVACILMVMTPTGVRPFELHRLSSKDVDKKLDMVFTENAKGFPNGRSVFFPPVLYFYLEKFNCFFQDGPWYLHPQGRDELTFG